MGGTTDTRIKGLAYALVSKPAWWIVVSNIGCYVQKHKDTIRQFQIIKKVHVESLKAQLKESET